MTPELAALRRAIEVRKAVAEDAATASRSARWWDTRDPLGYHVEPVTRPADRNGRIVISAGADMGAEPYESACIAAHIARNDPARVLRDCAEDLDVLERHAPFPSDKTKCSWCCGDPGDRDKWPCPDVLSIAHRYEVGI